ncbi:MAG: aminotransferase class-I, partial [Pseudomonadota bacterium]
MASTGGLVDTAREELIKRFRSPRRDGEAAEPVSAGQTGRDAKRVPEQFCRFDRFPAYEALLVQQVTARRFGLANPFFKLHEGGAGATTQVDGQVLINFSSYNYLGLCGHPRVNKATMEAIERYGTSASASRLVAGERPIQRQLEEEIAASYGVEACIAFVSGHATNVTTLGTLFGPKDLVVHDSLIHNSVLEGIRLSGAARRSFPHNDLEALDTLLSECRGQFERALVVVEGLYSM